MIVQQALKSALQRYVNVMNGAFLSEVKLKVLETNNFIAHAHLCKDSSVIVTVSTGVVKDTIALWQQAKELSEQTPEEYRLQIDDIDKAVDASLTWLMLHELHHAQIGHLELVGSAGISEIKQSPELGLTRQSKTKPATTSERTRPLQRVYSRCLVYWLIFGCHAPILIGTHLN